MTNKFLCVGTIQEFVCHFFPTHVKIKFTMEINNQTITCSQIINRKYNKVAYDYLCYIIPTIHTRISSFVRVNNEKYYEITRSDKPTRILSSGHINEYKGQIYFNSQYISINFGTNIKDDISIEVEGVWVDKNRFLNTTNNSPKIFHIDKPQNITVGCLYACCLGFNAGYKIDEDIVTEQDTELYIKGIKPMNKIMEQEEIDKWLLEHEIIND
jgi:hypothetical protein